MLNTLIEIPQYLTNHDDIIEAEMLDLPKPAETITTDLVTIDLTFVKMVMPSREETMLGTYIVFKDESHIVTPLPMDRIVLEWAKIKTPFFFLS